MVDVGAELDTKRSLCCNVAICWQPDRKRESLQSEPTKAAASSYCGLNTIPYAAAPTQSQSQRVAVSMKVCFKTCGRAHRVKLLASSDVRPGRILSSLNSGLNANRR